MTKKSVDDFKAMIEHAVDREELEDIRRMILEARDISFHEKNQLSDCLEEHYRTSPELRNERTSNH